MHALWPAPGAAPPWPTSETGSNCPINGQIQDRRNTTARAGVPVSVFPCAVSAKDSKPTDCQEVIREGSKTVVFLRGSLRDFSGNTNKSKKGGYQSSGQGRHVQPGRILKAIFSLARGKN